MNDTSGRHDPDTTARPWLDRVLSIAVLPTDRPDTVRTKRLFTGALWASITTTTISVYQYYLIDAPWAMVALTLPIVTAAVALFLTWRRPSTFPAVMHLVAAGTMGTTMIIIVLFGGVFETAGNTSWSVLAVVGAVAIFADRRAHFWLAVFIAGTIGAYLVSRVVEPLYVLPNRDMFALFNLIVVCVFIYVILYYFVRETARLYRQTDTLLRNVLPDDVADRLKDSDEMIADEFASASILFADVAGFTPMAATLEPGEVVTLLNEVFTDFDAMVAARGLEKIKTIGDSYMVAAGVPVIREDHARAICDLAIEMQEHIGSRGFAGHHLEMRIGIASGPVMAGIIGTHKFSYDLWGDTVNLASRMEATGTPGRIQVAKATHDMIAPWFVCEARGTVEVKGKGAIDTWYLVGRREE